MTLPVSGVITVPFCGSCGREPFGRWSDEDLASDLVCDSCGQSLLAYGWTAALVPPTDLAISMDDPGFGAAEVTWTLTVGSDSCDVEITLDDGSAVDPDETSPLAILAIDPGETLTVRVRCNDGDVKGPWSNPVSATAATLATGATAGTPGVWTGGGLRPAADVAAMNTQAIVADPLTLWTVGQSVETLDTNDAYWDGVDTWLVGTAPA